MLKRGGNNLCQLPCSDLLISTSPIVLFVGKTDLSKSEFQLFEVNANIHTTDIKHFTAGLASKGQQNSGCWT